MKALTEVFRGWDRRLWAAGIALVAVSGIAMASAASTVNSVLAVRHVMWTAVGILLSVAVANSSYRRWTDWAGLAYGASLVALLVVLLAGAMRLGAARWLSLFGFSLQPSELMKLATLLALTRYLAGQPLPLPGRVVGVSALLVGVPALLVFMQPDLGSASVFMALWLGMIWVAGAPRRIVAGVLGAMLALLPIAWHALKEYQRDRLLAFINPHADPLGTGYTIIQSTIAIGAGRWWGRGWCAGTQNQLSFLPERHSDFIFSVIGEEWGFFGCLAVVALFIVLLTRVLRIALEASDPQGRLLAAGVFAWLGYQAFVNMGMVMGVLPVVGVPLPLISYGGSSMVVIWAALGLLQNVHRSNRE